MSKILIALTILSVISLSLSALCGDGQSYCPDGTTCCELDNGSYGCCPYVEATCCDDHQHCCPNGYNCDLSAGQCVAKSGSLIFLDAPIDFVKNAPALKVETPSISDIVKCLTELKPVLSDLMEIAQAVKKGDISKLTEIFFRLIKNGKKASDECMALFK